ncbi:MAG: hypothetical protein Q4A58_07970 [Fusobacterium sp.]|uniref:hypothetical protein n=1 Tax=Fusobacterium sp. TaxID=68766 RepID=UPI0026DB1735|nr:hypothetical protein [Fusobacterium sp.]MDO4691213.1 hypothetical protein [Fusobacterium sp.]
MGAVRLRATIQETDMPYIERFLKGISAKEISFDNTYDFYYELSSDDLKKLELAEEQSKLGMVTNSCDVHREAIERLKR